MFTKQEASQIREEFWTVFGRYMTPVASAEGEKVNWINYKTGEKNIQFRMQAVDKTVRIGIFLNHTDEGIRQLYFEQFQELKKMLQSAIEEEWIWDAFYVDENGAESAAIYMEQSGLNILRREDWPEIISFFKPRIVALDDFWTTARYAFEALR